MKILRLTDSAAKLALVEDIAPRPQPGPGEVLVRVLAAGVTTTEIQWIPTTHTKNGGRRVHAVPAHEFSGVVAALGPGVSGFEIGQEVFGMNDWYADGALAEYCLTSASWIAHKPSLLTHAEAASVPIGALTAWQGLFDRARLRAGERVLVHGGAGAVGVFAVQLAWSRGAHVIATASARNLDFVLELGADQAIDYRVSRFEEDARDVDVIFDTVGGETFERSWSVLKPGGRLVTIVSTYEYTTDERAKRAFFIVEPNGTQLNEVGEMLEARHLRAVVDTVLPLAQASNAYTGEVRHGRGKLVVAVSDEERATARVS